MKRQVVTLLLLLLCGTAFGQFTYKQKLGDIAQIQFPDKPINKKTEDSSKLYICQYGTGVYLAQAAKVPKGLKDYFNRHFIDSVYQGYIGGYVKGLKGKVLYKNKISIGGLDAVEFGCKADVKANTLYSYHRAVYLNDTLLTMGLMTTHPLSKKDTAVNNFFRSFKLSTNGSHRQGNSDDLAFKIGTVVGYIIAIGLMIGIPFLFIFAIRKLALRGSKNK